MGGNVLSELYVDVVQRGLQETINNLRLLQRETAKTAAAMQAMKGAMSAGSAANTGGAGGGVMSAAGMGGLAAAAGPLAVAAAAIASAISVITTGLRGTAELEQFGMAILNIAKEIGNVFAPILRLVTSILGQLTAAFRSTGAAGQQLMIFAVLGPVFGTLFEVLSNPTIQGALRNLVTGLAAIVTALQPMFNLLANIANELIEVFVVAPLNDFIKGLTTIALLFAELVKRAVQFAQYVGTLAGFGRLFKTPERQRFEGTLNQTGTEDAAGTFQRIQQAVFKASLSEPQSVEDKQLKELEEIKEKVAIVVTLVDKALAFVGQAINSVPADAGTRIAQGFNGGGLHGAGVEIGGMILDRLMKR